MKTSNTGLNLIKHFEGLHDGNLKVIGLQPKMCPAGIWTEGWGRAMRDSKGNFIKKEENKKLAYSRQTIKTKEEADAALVNDIKVFENIVSRKISKTLNQNQFDALVSYTYNTGGSDSLFKYINKLSGGNDTAIKTWFKTKYITADGVIQRGLIERRKMECNLFFK